jgi:hypothetical protein
VRPIPMFWLLALISRATTGLSAQASPSTGCGDSLASAMAFLQGEWQGRSYSIAGRDTVLDGLMSVKSRPLLGRCALEEEWSARKDGRTLFTAKVIRAYDGPTQRWSVYYVDDQLNSQMYEGRMDGSQWRFFRTRLDQGKPVQVRLTWRPIRNGYEQLIERSRDGGTTWVVGGFVTFTTTSAPGP